MDSYLDVFVFLLVGALVVVIGIWVAYLLRPVRPYKEKLSVYECGELPFGDSRVRINIRYYIYALIFVVFDVETIFLYPWAVRFSELGLFGFVEMFIFIVILLIGLAYAWKKKVLEWV